MDDVYIVCRFSGIDSKIFPDSIAIDLFFQEYKESVEKLFQPGKSAHRGGSFSRFGYSLHN